MLSTGNAWAAWLQFYDGTLGNQRIGLTLQTQDTALPPAETPIENVYYFYVKHLRDIPLKLIKREGRRLTLAETDSAGTRNAILHLEFPPYDVLHYFTKTEAYAKKIEWPDEIVGTWESVDGKRKLPIKLVGHYAVSGEGAGRCGLDAASTKHLEDRVKAFQQAFVRGDAARLKRDFRYNLRRNSPFLQEVADSVPHDMFCRDVGFLFGSFWFNYDGNLINPPR